MIKLEIVIVDVMFTLDIYPVVFWRRVSEIILDWRFVFDMFMVESVKYNRYGFEMWLVMVLLFVNDMFELENDERIDLIAGSVKVMFWMWMLFKVIDDK